MNIAIIGTYPPRQCGIATFTHDLFKSLRHIHSLHPAIIAVSDGTEHSFPKEVSFVIEKDNIASYHQAVKYMNTTFDAVIIQHEYGIFGGYSGHHIVDAAKHLSIPIITNLHTVLRSPSKQESRILRQLASYSQKVTVMTQTAVQILKEVYKLSKRKVALIPHGVPHFKYSQSEAKKKLGLLDKKVMLSFGFLGPSKGFETAIEAVASVHHDDFLYIILGSTHPNILRETGEAYREALQDNVESLGIHDKVLFINNFATEESLIQYLSACDIYVTPYPNENQISSGTLSFAIGAGAAVISTPYWYAKDLLQDERGLLFDFKDSQGLARLINTLLERPELLAKFRCNAARYGKSMSWKNVGKLQMELLKEILNERKRHFSPTLPDTIQKNISNLLQVPKSKQKLFL